MIWNFEGQSLGRGSTARRESRGSLQRRSDELTEKVYTSGSSSADRMQTLVNIVLTALPSISDRASAREPSLPFFANSLVLTRVWIAVLAVFAAFTAELRRAFTLEIVVLSLEPRSDCEQRYSLLSIPWNRLSSRFRFHIDSLRDGVVRLDLENLRLVRWCREFQRDTGSRRTDRYRLRNDCP